MNPSTSSTWSCATCPGYGALRAGPSRALASGFRANGRTRSHAAVLFAVVHIAIIMPKET
eukprot:5305309-Pleurochrysis_carterae.AAC.1